MKLANITYIIILSCIGLSLFTLSYIGFYMNNQTNAVSATVNRGLQVYEIFYVIPLMLVFLAFIIFSYFYNYKFLIR